MLREYFLGSRTQSTLAFVKYPRALHCTASLRFKLNALNGLNLQIGGHISRSFRPRGSKNMVNNVQTLIKYVVESFAEKKNEIEYLVEEKENVIEVTVLLNASDMGKVIGKQGKIAKALRTLVSASTPRDSKRYVVEIKEKA